MEFLSKPEDPKDGDWSPIEFDDDGRGFRMVDTMDLKAVNASIPLKLRSCKQPKVVNLIDFSECNLPEEPVELVANAAGADNASTDEGSLSGVSNATQASTEPLSVLVGPSTPTFVDDDGSSGRPLRPATPGGASQDELLQEVLHLRQRLADAAEETRIQVGIARDDAFEKERQIEELLHQCAHSEALRAQAEASLARKCAKHDMTARQKNFSEPEDERDKSARELKPGSSSPEAVLLVKMFDYRQWLRCFQRR